METTRKKIIDNLDKLNDKGLDAIQGVVNGFMRSATFCKDSNKKGLIIHMFLTNPSPKPRKDVFKRLDQAVPGVVIQAKFPYRGGAAL